MSLNLGISYDFVHYKTASAVEGVTGFVCGAYFQHECSIRNLFYLIQTDPNVYHHRHKLYPVLSTFKTDHESRLWNRQSRLKDKLREVLVAPLYDIFSCIFLMKEERPPKPPNMLELIKFGLPGTENVSAHKEYVMSQQLGTKATIWMCEHLHRNNVQKLVRPTSGEDFLHRFTDIRVLSSNKANMGRVFTSNIWYELEMYIIHMAIKNHSVYAYTGPLYLPNCSNQKDWSLDYEIIDWIPVPVPSHYFKVLVMDPPAPDCSPYMEGFIIPNRRSLAGSQLHEFLSDVEEIERYTGLNFANCLRHHVLIDGNDFPPHDPSKRPTLEELSERVAKFRHVTPEEFM
ncbi:endonuclease G, mitochondrial [Scaptodrosophila lebanonensis]|uniref:Endonuclease G, mitochondrial n=1 Tax=Drosophila lebanonensis TaxID=7225 RepID=A0A6J2U684_DROLE|nr:endonuclease G, mitochondrial [Scaptodrosophila lebanonensis]